MKVVAIIPARGGSKRIPKKNIRPFNGRPVMAYPIETALESALFDEVMVSTDDDEIAAVAKKYGASVPFRRSTENASDFATTSDLLCEVINEYAKRGQQYDLACCIYPMTPFLSVELFTRAQSLLLDGGYDSVFPIVRYSYPIQRSLQLKDGKVSMIWPENLTARSQDLVQAYHDAGQFYWFKVESFMQSKQLWTDNSGGVIISEMQAHDVDTVEDWSIAEFKYRFLKEK